LCCITACSHARVARAAQSLTLAVGWPGSDVDQAEKFSGVARPGDVFETIRSGSDDLDIRDAIRVIEDYKPLDVQSAVMALALCRGIRRPLPDWKYLVDGDGGDENLKTIRSKRTPSSRSAASSKQFDALSGRWGGRGDQAFADLQPAARARTHPSSARPACSTRGFSPYALPNVIEVAEGIPFIDLTDWQHDKALLAQRRDHASRVEAVTG